MDVSLKVKKKIEELIVMGDIENAKKLLDEYSKIGKEDYEYYSYSGIISIVENDFKKAIDDMKIGLMYNEHNFDLNYNIAFTYENMNDFSKSHWHYKRCLEVDFDESNKSGVVEKINQLESNHEINYYNYDKKIVFFVKVGMDAFLNDIVEETSKFYNTVKIIVTNYTQIDLGVGWADTCWFEWCDELVIYGSKLRHDQKTYICRIHGYEVYSDYIRQVKWDNVNQLIIVAPHIRRIFEEKTQDLNKNNLKIETIFCGINIDKYPLLERKSGFKIGYLGYINFKKNIPLTLDIFKKLHDLDNRYELHIAGEVQDPRTYSYLLYFLKEYDLEDSFFFYGWLDNSEKVEWFEQIDYMLVSSIDEGLCFAAAESMCSGIKPILHNCEGIKDHYDKKYIFNNVDEAVKMITTQEYNSKEYRNFILENYSLNIEMEKIIEILNLDVSNSEAEIDCELCSETSLTVIIPTKDRTELLLRCTRYFIDMEFHNLNLYILILDSSEDGNKEVNKKNIDMLKKNYKNITYINYESDLPFYNKIHLGINNLNSKYVLICADDDFYNRDGIIKSIGALESNPNVITVRGKTYVFTNNDTTKLFERDIDRYYGIKGENRFSRLTNFVEKYIVQTIYSVYRKEDMDHILSFIINHKNSFKLNQNFQEYLFYFLVVIKGNVELINELVNIRDYSSSSARYNIETFYHCILNESFNDNYFIFKQMIIDFVNQVEYDNDIVKDIENNIDRIFRLFMIKSLLFPEEKVIINDGKVDLEPLKYIARAILDR